MIFGCGGVPIWFIVGCGGVPMWDLRLQLPPIFGPGEAPDRTEGSRRTQTVHGGIILRR
jgi:hypothetical protein